MGGMNRESIVKVNQAALIPMGSQGEESFSSMWRTITKRKWIILGSTLVIFCAVAVHTLRTKPVYESVVLLKIDSSSTSNLGLDDVVNAKVGDDPDSRMATEIKLIQSDTVAARVIDALGLARRPEFAGQGASSTPFREVRAMSPADRQRLIGKFKSSLLVRMLPGTQLVELRYRSSDPKFAAEAANALAEQYIQRNFQTHYEGAVQVSSWLSKEMADLQNKAVEAQQKLAEFQKQNNILGADENDNIVTDRLKVLNNQVSEAEAERIVQQARYLMTKTGDPELIANAYPTPTLQLLRGQRLELKTQLAELSSKYGSGFPKVNETKEQLAKLDAAIASELGNAVKHVENQYQTSAKTESLLRNQFNDAKDAAYLLNQHAVQFSVLKHEVETSRALYDTLQVKLEVAGVTAGLNSGYINVVDPADIPVSPILPNVRSNLAMGLLGGLLIGLLLAFVTESFDDTVSTSSELELCTGLPVLCSVPVNSLQGRLKGESGEGQKAGLVLPVMLSNPRSAAAEAFRGLRSSILLSTPDLQPKVIAVVSSVAMEGKTTVAANLGISFAQQGESVLMIDGDLRRSSLHTRFGVPYSSTGTSTLLTQRTNDGAIVTPLESLPNLKLLPAGPHPPNPAELLGSKRMVEVLEAFSEDYDRIIIDTPPILSVADSLAMSHFADAVVLVVRSGIARKKSVLRVRDLLQRANANLVGVVFNCVNLQLESYYSTQRTKYGKAMKDYYYASDGEAD